MLQSSVSCDMLVFYVIITNTMAYWYDGAALAATRSPVIALFWCLIKFTTTTTTTMEKDIPNKMISLNTNIPWFKQTHRRAARHKRE